MRRYEWSRMRGASQDNQRQMPYDTLEYLFKIITQLYRVIEILRLFLRLIRCDVNIS